VQRALLPIITKSIYDIIPASLSNGTKDWLLSFPKVQKEINRLGWEKDYIIQYIIILSLSFLSLVGFVFVFRNLFAFFYSTKNEILNSIPIIALFCLPPFFHYGNHYVYDFPALFFFTSGILLLLEKKWIPFYIIFIAGLINKETIAFLTLVYIIINYNKLEKKNFYRHLTMQIFLIAVYKTILTFIFSNNPGSFGVFSLFINLDFLFRPYSLYFLLSAAVILFLIFADLSKKPESLKRMSLIAVLFGILFLFYGRIVEVRALYEIFPVILIMALHTVFFYIFKCNYELKNE
jgi:hypothetical protein